MQPLSPQSPSAEGGVELVRWPQDEALRSSLARAGVPRLLVLAEGAPPPESLAFDEDWIREPYSTTDLRARVQRIVSAVEHQARQATWIDEQRVLHRGTRTAVLTASEAVVADALLSSPGRIVSRASLESRLWPAGGPPSARAVDAIVYRLRRHCRDLGIMIRSARGEGFVLLAGPS